MDSRFDEQAVVSRQGNRPWEGLAEAADKEVFQSSWLAIQCSMIRGCCQAVLALREPGSQRFAPVASWPEGAKDVERLAEIIDQALSEQEGMLVELSHVDGMPRYGLAYPIFVDTDCFGVVAVEVETELEEMLRPAMENLQWGAVWIQNSYRRRRNLEDSGSLDRLKAAVDILAGVLAGEDFDSAAMSFVTSISTRLVCDRVSLGLIRKKFTRVAAVSHSAVVGEKMNLLRAIGAAMDEAVGQRTEIIHPPPSDSEAVVRRNHEHLAQKHGTMAIITVPLFSRGQCYGALTLEREKNRPFTPDDLAYVQSVAALSGPALENRQKQDRSAVVVVYNSLKRQVARVFGTGYPGRKAAFLAAALIAFFLFTATGDYRISADTVLEGAVQRYVVAPFDGFIQDAPVRAGDVVATGDLLCALDDRDLRLDRIHWVGRQNQYKRQLQESLARRSRSEANIIEAQLDQATAKLEMAESMLERVAIRAPFNGVLLSGDLSQRLGSAVRQGEELFQIAPLDAYRLILKVHEGRIAAVEEGQKGVLVLSALPADKFDFTVTRITPQTTAAEGLNYFRVEASLDNLSPLLRPGMEGVGKIHVDERLLVTIWTRPLLEWLRLKLWSLWP